MIAVIADWDDAYANAPHIPGGDGYPPRWEALAAAFRAAAGERLREGLPYGPHPRQRFDLFLPEGAPRGLVVFVHGGYWRAFDRGTWSHLAAAPLDAGWAVAMPGYVLAPEARIAAITAMIAEAVAAAAAEVAGPIRLCGHSAGGHLVVRQVCDDSRLPAEVAARVERVVAISGLHDLRPLLRLKLNAEALKLDAAEAAAESPALREPRTGRPRARLGRRRRAAGVRAADDAPRQHLDRARRRHGADDRAAAPPFQRHRRADAPGLGAGRGGRRMRSRARAVVIGGGVVGCSVLYHLAKAGWTDVDADRAVRAHLRLVLARRRRLPHPERRPERREAAGLYRRALPRARGGSPASPAGCT